MNLLPFVLVTTLVLFTSTVTVQDLGASQIAQERKEAELESPRLVDILGLGPGMTVTDVDAGFGAMTVVLGEAFRSGRVFCHGYRRTSAPGDSRSGSKLPSEVPTNGGDHRVRVDVVINEIEAAASIISER